MTVQSQPIVRSHQAEHPTLYKAKISFLLASEGRRALSSRADI